MSDGQGNRWRWWVAYQLNRLPNQCWTDLVSWALGWNKARDERRSPWSPIGGSCRDGVTQCGTCYCGKIQSREFKEKYPGVTTGRVVE